MNSITRPPEGETPELARISRQNLEFRLSVLVMRYCRHTNRLKKASESRAARILRVQKAVHAQLSIAAVEYMGKAL